MNPTLCLFGFGYTAAFLAEQASLLGFNITGTSRSQETRDDYRKQNYHLVDFKATDVDIVLRRATHVFISTPPSSLGDPVLTDFLPLLETYCHQWQWIGYASSTGVYGNHEGAWVNESSPTHALGPQAQRRLEAETAWLAFAKKHNLPLHIFRLAGIYGPARNALKEIVAGKAYSIYKEGQVFSRIHVSDIAKVIIASLQKPNPYSIYNLADDEPASSLEVDHYATTLLNRSPLPIIPFEKASLSPMAKEFYSNNRRVSNSKIKREFDLELDYPSYREGLLQLYEKKQY